MFMLKTSFSADSGGRNKRREIKIEMGRDENEKVHG
jgi:hypothetical protein